MGPLGGLAGLATAILAGLIFLWRERRIRLWEAARLADLVRSRPARQVRRILEEHEQAVSAVARVGGRPALLLATLLHAQAEGLVLRITAAPLAFLPPIRLIRVLFEPILLNESEPVFLEWSARVSGQAEQPQPRTDDFLRTIGRRIRRSYRHNELTLGLLLLLLCLGVSGLLIVLILLGWAARSRSLRSQAWIIPGGVMLPDRRLVFRRSDSILAWYPQRRRIHLASHRWGHHCIPVTWAEAQLCLSAWHSPVASPTDEMLDAFWGTG